MRSMKHTDTTKKNEVLCAFTIIGTKLRDTFGNQAHQRGGYLCVISGCMSFILGGYFISYCNIYFFLGSHGSWSWNLLCTSNEQNTYDSRGRRRPQKKIRKERKERSALQKKRRTWIETCANFTCFCWFICSNLSNDMAPPWKFLSLHMYGVSWGWSTIGSKGVK